MSTSKPKPFHHGALKASLARTAWELVNANGLERFSLREVARHANVSPAAPYRHYATRDDLLAAVAQAGFDRLEQQLSAVDDRGTAVAAFEREAAIYVAFATDNPAIYRLMFGSHLDKREHRDLAEASDRLFAVLDRRLRHLPPGVREAQAVGCWALLHGVAILMLDGQLDRHDRNRAALSAIIAPFVAYAFPAG